MFKLYKPKQLPAIPVWNAGDQSEAIELFGWEIDMLLKHDALDSFYVAYKPDDSDEEVIVSVMQMDVEGNLTYFTTEAITAIPIKGYLTFLKSKLDAYLELVNYPLITQVTKDYRQGIFTLEQLGFRQFIEYHDRWTYGKQLKDS